MENHGVWIEPIEDHLVLGEVKKWAEVVNARPMRIPGYWLGRPNEEADMPSGAPPAPGEKVVFATHGGAYISQSASPNDPTANVAKGLLQHIPSVRRVFSVEYRLSSGPPRPANPFPTALLDALAGYAYLVRVVKFEPANIIVEGDSAGGNLALALVRYLVENAAGLADAAAATGTSPLLPPGAVVLLSPWCDLGTSHDRPPPAYFARTDYIGSYAGPMSKYPHAALMGAHGLAEAETNAYVSPAARAARVAFRDWPRTFLVCGGAEWLAGSIRTLKERMSADMGEGSGPGQLTYYEASDAVHDYVGALWHEPERTETLIKIGEWVETM